jgi:Cu(I)/Ag(I) efflux system membrane protein CusA/SilA
MIARLIRWSIANRLLVLLATLLVGAWGAWAMLRTPLDAIPDLSDVQVIIRTTFPGQAPQIVENQITYPLATTMMSVPGAKTVRGYSMFGDSGVHRHVLPGGECEHHVTRRHRNRHRCNGRCGSGDDRERA